MTYISKEELESAIASDRTVGVSWSKFHNQCFLDIITEGRMGYSDANLNEACPQVRPLDANEFLQKWWVET